MICSFSGSIVLSVSHHLPNLAGWADQGYGFTWLGNSPRLLEDFGKAFSLVGVVHRITPKQKGNHSEWNGSPIIPPITRGINHHPAANHPGP
jgi:hypothetical protein